MRPRPGTDAVGTARDVSPGEQARGRGAGGSVRVCQNPLGLVFNDGKGPDQSDQGVGA
jgi:hypothetical protein